MKKDKGWRNGRKVKRTLYLNGKLVGLVDTEKLAVAICRAMNRTKGRTKSQTKGRTKKVVRHSFTPDEVFKANPDCAHRWKQKGGLLLTGGGPKHVWACQKCPGVGVGP